MSPDDPRAARPLFTVSEAAGWLAIPRSTLHGWVSGGGRQPVIQTLPGRRGEAAVPFLGLVEGLVLRAFRRAGVPLQRIRPALDRLDQELGMRHALASDRLAVDGLEVLYDYGARHDPGAIAELVTVRSGQLVIAPVVGEQLRRIRYADDHWAEQVELPGYAIATVIVNPCLASGRPVLQGSCVPVQDVVHRWVAGDSLAGLSDRFGIDPVVLEDVLRGAVRRSRV
jgi:uncharacterized protein (DUF433 family)